MSSTQNIFQSGFRLCLEIVLRVIACTRKVTPVPYGVWLLVRLRVWHLRLRPSVIFGWQRHGANSLES